LATKLHILPIKAKLNLFLALATILIPVKAKYIFFHQMSQR